VGRAALFRRGCFLAFEVQQTQCLTFVTILKPRLTAFAVDRPMVIIW
jgi:hypothetical protein